MGIGHGRFDGVDGKVDPLDVEGLCWCCKAGESTGVDVALLRAGDAAGAAGFAFEGAGGGGTLEPMSSSASRRRLTPLDELSFRPSAVAFIKI